MAGVWGQPSGVKFVAYVHPCFLFATCLHPVMTIVGLKTSSAFRGKMGPWEFWFSIVIELAISLTMGEFDLGFYNEPVCAGERRTSLGGKVGRKPQGALPPFLCANLRARSLAFVLKKLAGNHLDM